MAADPPGVVNAHITPPSVDGEINITSDSGKQYLKDVHDVFNSCDKIKEKLSRIPSHDEEKGSKEDLNSIKETASVIVGDVIARAISEEEKRKKNDVPNDSFGVMSNEGNNAEFLDREKTMATVADTDEDAAAEGEYVNQEMISNDTNAFISVSGSADQEATRSNSQASLQAAEILPEEMSETRHDELEGSSKLLRQESFMENGQDPYAQDLEDRPKETETQL